jgi:hypothetical protein
MKNQKHKVGFLLLTLLFSVAGCIAQKTLGVTFTESGKGAGIQSGTIEKTSYATPATVSSTLTNLNQAVAVLEFTVKENGAKDGYPLEIKELRFKITGNADVADLRFVLEGPGSNNTTAEINGNVATFKNFGNIIVTDGDITGKTYQVKGQIRAGTNGSTVEGNTIAVSIDPLSDVDVAEASSNLLPTVSSMQSGVMAVSVVATELQGKGNFSFGNIAVSAIFPGTPAFYATDENGRVDKDYVTNVTLVSRQADCIAAETGLGNSATGANLTLAAVQGVATFSNLMFNTAAKTFKVYATSGALTAQCTAAITTP